MAQCPKCHKHGLVEAQTGRGAILLDPHAKCYAAVEMATIFPEDGSRVFLATALVEHAAVCSAERREQADQRQAGKEQYERRQAVKAGR